jgi:transcriptional regulator with AAA-type ATPase domain
MQVGSRVATSRTEVPPLVRSDYAGPAPIVSHRSGELAGLIGRNRMWLDVCRRALQYRDSSSQLPLVLTGEAGVGKSALADSLYLKGSNAGQLCVLDAKLRDIPGYSPSLAAIEQALADPQAVVMVKNLELLPREDVHRLLNLLDRSGFTKAKVVATVMTSSRRSHWVLDSLTAYAPACLEVPSLRNRLDDLALLVEEFTIRNSTDRFPPIWLPETIQSLRRARWEHNIRELYNTVKSVLITCTGNQVTPDDLPASVQRQALKRNLSEIELVELHAIMLALRTCAGNRSKAAERLGISRSTLYRKARVYGLAQGNSEH